MRKHPQRMAGQNRELRSTRCRSTFSCGFTSNVRMVGSEETGAAARATGVTTLLADDTPDLQALLSTWLEEAGHTVTRASNGHEVVALVRQQSFDLVVTDILMPGGDGWDA